MCMCVCAGICECNYVVRICMCEYCRSMCGCICVSVYNVLVYVHVQYVCMSSYV